MYLCPIWVEWRKRARAAAAAMSMRSEPRAVRPSAPALSLSGGSAGDLIKAWFGGDWSGRQQLGEFTVDSQGHTHLVSKATGSAIIGNEYNLVGHPIEIVFKSADGKTTRRWKLSGGKVKSTGGEWNPSVKGIWQVVESSGSGMGKETVSLDVRLFGHVGLDIRAHNQPN